MKRWAHHPTSKKVRNKQNYCNLGKKDIPIFLSFCFDMLLFFYTLGGTLLSQPLNLRPRIFSAPK